ncbi:MAG: class I SAM-dependent methyltransferase [Isosphaeraceae bacterium]
MQLHGLASGLVGLVASLVVYWLPVRPGQEPTAPSAKSAKAGPERAGHGEVDHQINAQFEHAKVADFIKRFESSDREVYARRHEIARALSLSRGMAVADVGAGTGIFTRLFADAVGPSGKVYAVEISKPFLDHIAESARKEKHPQIITIQGSQDTTNLSPGAVDLVFLCDVYHHLENHRKILSSLHQALRTGGSLVLIEFDRVEGKSKPFVLAHVRASRQEFQREIEAAGFARDVSFHGPRLTENFALKFRKLEPGAGDRKGK